MHRLPHSVTAILLALPLLLACGATRSAEIAAPYVPTAPSVVERMLEIAGVRPDDYLIDLGSGDGRIVITAARKYGTRGHGIEFEPDLVALARKNARAAGVSDRATFEEADLWTADLSKATVVTIYLLTRSTLKLRERLLELRPGTRIVSHAGSMGEWKADHFEMLDVRDKVRTDAPSRTYIYFWTVPARVAGVWRWSAALGGATQKYELTLSQQFQNVTGTVRAGGFEMPLDEAKLEGERISLAFTAEIAGQRVRQRLEGRVQNGEIVGTIVAGSTAERSVGWKAVRVGGLPAGPHAASPARRADTLVSRSRTANGNAPCHRAALPCVV